MDDPYALYDDPYTAPRYNPFFDAEVVQQFNSATFWPADPSLPVPQQYYDCFNFPTDDVSCAELSNSDLLTHSVIHHGRFMALYSRLIKKETSGAGSDRIINKLKDQLLQADQERAKMRQIQEDLRRNALKAVNQNTIYQQDLRKLQTQNDRLINTIRINPELLQIKEQLAEANKKCTELSDELLQAQHRETKLEEQNHQYMLDLSKLHETHAVAQASMQKLSEANRTLYLEVEQHQEVVKHNESLQQDLHDAHRQIEALEQTSRLEQAEQKETEEALRREVAELKQQEEQQKQQLGHLQQELRAKSEHLAKFNESYKRAYEEHKKDREVLKKLHAQNKALKENHQRIIAEYRSSPELTEEIAAEFGKGFQSALKKVQATGIDPKSVGFSDDDLLWLDEDSESDPAGGGLPPQ